MNDHDSGNQDPTKRPVNGGFVSQLVANDDSPVEMLSKCPSRKDTSVGEHDTKNP